MASKKSMHALKPGSSADDARQMSGKNDFGASSEDTVEREYISENTKRADPGGVSPASFEERGGTRMAGAGGDDAGPGSSSGGDLDTDFVGIGATGGLAQNIDRHHHAGADDAAQTSTPDRQARAAKPVPPSRGSTQLPVDDRTITAEGADSVGRESIDGDGSFVGEISMAEADGDDEAGR